MCGDFITCQYTWLGDSVDTIVGDLSAWYRYTFFVCLFDIVPCPYPYCIAWVGGRAYFIGPLWTFFSSYLVGGVGSIMVHIKSRSEDILRISLIS